MVDVSRETPQETRRRLRGVLHRAELDVLGGVWRFRETPLHSPPALSMRFGTSTDGLPIGVQVAGAWHAESTVLHVAELVESLSPVKDQHPDL